jgi:hypothetical protein
VVVPVVVGIGVLEVGGFDCLVVVGGADLVVPGGGADEGVGAAGAGVGAGATDAVVVGDGADEVVAGGTEEVVVGAAEAVVADGLGFGLAFLCFLWWAFLCRGSFFLALVVVCVLVAAAGVLEEFELELLELPQPATPTAAAIAKSSARFIPWTPLVARRLRFSGYKCSRRPIVAAFLRSPGCRHSRPAGRGLGAFGGSCRAPEAASRLCTIGAPCTPIPLRHDLRGRFRLPRRQSSTSSSPPARRSSAQPVEGFADPVKRIMADARRR